MHKGTGRNRSNDHMARQSYDDMMASIDADWLDDDQPSNHFSRVRMVQELRRSSAASRHRNKKVYNRKSKYKGQDN